MAEATQKITVNISEIKHGMQWAVSNSAETLQQAVRTEEEAKKVYKFYTGRDTDMCYEGIMEELIMLLEGKHNDKRANSKLASLRQNGNPELNFIIEELQSAMSLEYLYRYLQVLGYRLTPQEMKEQLTPIADEVLQPGTDSEVAVNKAGVALSEIVRYREEMNLNCRMFLVCVKMNGFEYGVATVYYNDQLVDHKGERFLYLDNVTKHIAPIIIWYLLPCFRAQLPSLLSLISGKVKALAHKLHCKCIYTLVEMSMIEPYKSHGFTEAQEKIIELPCSVNLRPEREASVLLSHSV